MSIFVEYGAFKKSALILSKPLRIPAWDLDDVKITHFMMSFLRAISPECLNGFSRDLGVMLNTSLGALPRQ